MPKKKAVEPTKPSAISIEPLKLGFMEVTIEGSTPLLCNRPREEVMAGILQKQMSEGTKLSKTARAPRDPQKEVAGSMYKISDGVYGFPSGGFKKCLAVTSTRFGDAKGKQLVFGAVQINTDLLKIQGSKPQTDERGVRLKNGSFVPSFRGRFPAPWTMVIPIEFNESMISKDELATLIQHAGFSTGIGSYRVENGGPYGKFVVKKVRYTDKVTTA